MKAERVSLAGVAGVLLVTALAVALPSVVSVVHSMGTVAGILSPPAGFRVTENVGDDV